MGNFELANRLAELVTGRFPEWKRFFSDIAENASPKGALGTPTTSGAGVTLQNAPKTLVSVDLRKQVHRRQVRIQIAVLDLTATYTVIVDGNSVAFDAGGAGSVTNEDVIDGIAAAIAADGTVNLIVNALAIDEADLDGTPEITEVERDTVRLEGIAEGDYSIDHSATGSGVMTVYADPISADLKVWARLRGKSSDTPADSVPVPNWRIPLGADAFAVSNVEGFVERFDTAGLDRFYCELENVTAFAGDAATTAVIQRGRVYIGPAIEEP